MRTPEEKQAWLESTINVKAILSAYKAHKRAVRVDSPEIPKELCNRCGWGQRGARAHHLVNGFLHGRTWEEMERNHPHGDESVLPNVKKAIELHGGGLCDSSLL